MRWDPDSFSAELQQAANAYERNAVVKLCDDLVEELKRRTKPYPVESAKNDLATLRKKRWFDLMSKVADAYLRSGIAEPQIRRQYAQAMLDRGDVTGALPILNEIRSEKGVSAREYAEAVGLIGRAHKQIYMDAWLDGRGGRARHYQHALLRAFDSYNEIYEKDHERYLWQGINAASLLARAADDDVETGERPDPIRIAEQVRDTVNEKKRAGEAHMWDLACLAEAHVALALHGNRDARRAEWERAARTLKDYVEHDWADAFELASTLRQYEEVWRLDKGEQEEAVLLDMLRAELLKHSGGGMTLKPENLRAATAETKGREQSLEALLGGHYQSHSWLMDCLNRARAVAHIWKGRRGVGSGFIVPGATLSDRWKDHQVLVTNNHVIATEPRLSITLAPEQASITFDALSADAKEAPRYTVAEVLDESLFDDLDFTCVRLDRNVDGVEAYPPAKVMPSADKEERVYVIGHPLGGELSYSIQDNQVLAMNERFIHYRSPTEKGSSGSPLFDGDWNLVGLHHAGSEYMERLDDPDETYEANEGIPLPAIVKAINEPERVSAG